MEIEGTASGSQRVVLMGGRRAKEGHQLIAMGIHINFVDNPVVAMDHRLSAAIIGIKHLGGGIDISAKLA